MKLIYVIQNIVGGRIVWNSAKNPLGGESKAAELLTPGRTYGTGWSEDDALAMAEANRQVHLAEGYVGPPNVSQRRHTPHRRLQIA